jgi:hypothetical protein
MASNDKQGGSGVALPRKPIGLYYNAATAVGSPAGRWVICQRMVPAETQLNGALQRLVCAAATRCHAATDALLHTKRGLLRCPSASTSRLSAAAGSGRQLTLLTEYRPHAHAGMASGGIDGNEVLVAALIELDVQR